MTSIGDLLRWGLRLLLSEGKRVRQLQNELADITWKYTYQRNKSQALLEAYQELYMRTKPKAPVTLTGRNTVTLIDYSNSSGGEEKVVPLAEVVK